MKQVSVTLSTYTADVSGVCSALYELGGMVVIHDPSGCNSTYNTHDEPRWYDMDSLVFISGLSQMDAIMGNDDKFINDIVRAAKELKPRFIALVRTPIPLMTGTDFEGIARIIEKQTNPSLLFPDQWDAQLCKRSRNGAGDSSKRISTSNECKWAF